MSSNASVLGVHGVDEIGIDANQAHQNMLNLVELIPDLRKMGISKMDANEILAIEQQIDEATNPVCDVESWRPRPSRFEDD